MKKITSLMSVLCITALLSACGGDDNNSSHSSSASSISSSIATSSAASSSSAPAVTTVKLSISITNLTAGQPLSPTAISLHKPTFKAFEIGEAASVAVEQIAESGNSDVFLSDAIANTATFTTGKASAGIPPGATGTIMLETNIQDAELSMLRLTALSMLGNTNDGFTGLNGVDVSNLIVGESVVIDTLSYEAGTEMNTESAATVPGPAAGGEGFNPIRDDIPNTVAMHTGALTKDNGNPDSALTYINRWDNPTARIIITRVAP